jgi:hypothetical protein
MALGSTQPLTEMSTRNILWSKGRPARKADNFTAIYEPIVYKMWEPQHLTTLWASPACCSRGSSPGRVKNFLFSKSSRPALGSTQPPIQRVPMSISQEVKQQRREAYTIPSSTEVKNCGAVSPLPHMSS